ncbi:hypothetical protein K474DRAFT_1713395 [Panus rudis PR-1116 ss-1]|nr:hypothetical protein K474DRAFT_1713395 [Panus rudis PR-1116 ss-1]
MFTTASRRVEGEVPTNCGRLESPNILGFHLENEQIKLAVRFVSHYQHLVFFAHSLEILLHSLVEEDAGLNHTKDEGTEDDPRCNLLSRTIEFLDHFDACLNIVVGCARKIEMTRTVRSSDSQILETWRAGRVDASEDEDEPKKSKGKAKATAKGKSKASSTGDSDFEMDDDDNEEPYPKGKAASEWKGKTVSNSKKRRSPDD